jgi:hypothetical protein
VLAIRSGNKLIDLIGWHDTNAISIVGRFLLEFRKAGLRAEQIWGDSGGLGLPMCDMLRDAGWPINRFSFGGKPTDEDHYVSRGAEVWHSFAQRVARGELVLLNDPTLVSQLTSRKSTLDARGRLGIEKKDDMAARGVKSPDRRTWGANRIRGKSWMRLMMGLSGANCATGLWNGSSTIWGVGQEIERQLDDVKSLNTQLRLSY